MFHQIYVTIQNVEIIVKLVYTIMADFQNYEKRLLASSCLSVRIEQLGSHWTDFHEIRYLGIFGKSVEIIQVFIKG